MRRRKEKDKRVLKSRYSQPPKQKRRIRNNHRNRNPYRNKKASKTSKTTMLLIILALIAFVAGAGAGVSMALGAFDDNNATEEVHVENVTVEMTSNLNKSNFSIYDGYEKIDYNSPNDIAEYNLTNHSTNY